ncbi:hypothetical protein SETIT_9G310000v2 [Setaria italica]|uniref:Histone-binding protein RBBP4-like N-terminal domain-containing protein n=1 Tax=Setaria italica TaxID=4555 RepID=A0A368SMJ6_SETIT|nr:hypothetical protein SETIT_9G310000v2 [Setaria italica]
MGRVKRSKKAAKSKKKQLGEPSSSSAIPAKVWQPGVDALEDGEELQYDPTAYNYFHQFVSIGCPFLSFDVVRDHLGLVRSEFPHTLYGVAGTQTPKGTPNYVGIFMLSNMKGKMPRPDGECDMDGDSSSDDEEGTKDTMQLKKVAHAGSVNRIRSMTQKPHLCATWGETGHVQVWDYSSFLNSLSDSGMEDKVIHKLVPLKVFSGHKDEGFAIDWNPLVTGRLVSGDLTKCIHLWEPTSSNWNIDANPFVGHSKSVEDLQWSPTEADIFASSSADKTIAIWDIRTGKKPCIIMKAHNSDVNVISWNRLANNMIASGSDDGSVSVHDYRLIKKGVGSLAAHFKYHKKAITSIEWSPFEASTLAVSSEDHQLTIWDLAVERDAEGEDEFESKMQDHVKAPEDLPPQLLFVHQGQKHWKEVHWHPQVPGMLVATGIDGLDVLMPSNVAATLY